jgi:hypothetical protein
MAKILEAGELKAHEAHMARCRADFNAFMEYCFTDSQTRQSLKQGAIHRQWDAHIRAHNRAMIEAPREHGKTEQIPIGRVVWELGNNPQLRVKIICQGDRTATKRLTSLKGHIERNARVQEVFPNLRPHPEIGDWSKTTITIDREGEDKDPSVEACGVLSAGVGGRADLLVFDDVVDFRNAILQPVMRDLVKQVFRDVWTNLLTKDGRAIYIATPWHEDDLTADLKKNPAWAVLEQPIPEDLTPIWPEMWDKERLQARKKEIGPRSFARNFHLRAISDEDQLFRAISLCLRPDLWLDDVDPLWPKYTGVDLGHSKRKQIRRGGGSEKKKPYSVIFTLAIDPSGRRWPVDIRRGHWSGPQTAREVVEINRQYQPMVIMVESNAYQDTMQDWIALVSDDKSIPVQPFVTGSNKADEQIGLPSLAAEFDNRIWMIPTDELEEDELEEEWPEAWYAWFSEMRGYPASDLSDTVMACWFAREAVRRTNIKGAMVSDDDAGVVAARREREKAGELARLRGEPETVGVGMNDWTAYDAKSRRGR